MEHKNPKQADDKPVCKATVRKKKTRPATAVITGDSIISEWLRKWFPPILWLILLFFLL